MTEIRRLNWGCGPFPAQGWINADQYPAPGVDLVGDIRHGLPLLAGSIDYAASIHALPEIPYPDLPGVLWELKRVLKPDGVLRLGLPDLDRGIQAYLQNDRSYFLIPDEAAQSIGAKLITQLIWYGFSRTLFTYDFIAEQLLKAGFRGISQCRFRETASLHAEIVQLDNRERESIFVEAIK